MSKTGAFSRSSLEIRSKNILMQQNLTMSTEACHRGELCSISYVWIDGTAEAQLPCGHQFHRACMTKWLICGSLQCPMCNLVIGENCSNCGGCAGVVQYPSGIRATWLLWSSFEMTLAWCGLLAFTSASFFCRLHFASHTNLDSLECSACRLGFSMLCFF